MTGTRSVLPHERLRAAYKELECTAPLHRRFELDSCRELKGSQQVIDINRVPQITAVSRVKESLFHHRTHNLERARRPGTVYP